MSAYTPRSRSACRAKTMPSTVPPGDGVPDSPIGPGLSEAELATVAKDGYFGYRYRVLTRQGSHVAGGAYS